MASKRKQFNFPLPHQMHTALMKMCEQDNLSQASFVMRLIDEEWARSEAGIKLTLVDVVDSVETRMNVRLPETHLKRIQVMAARYKKTAKAYIVNLVAAEKMWREGKSDV